MTEQAQRVFQIQRIYVKDLSFESPGAPEVFSGKWSPTANMQLNNSARRIGEGNDYEVEVAVTLTAEQEGKTIYLVEIKQAGIFTISGAGEQELEQLLGAYCPSILFPYLREVVASTINHGSFPAFQLQPINFDALFQQAKAKRAEQVEQADQTAH
ncbi:MAG: protein-export chaperone SecB [Gammaproteobacteria bacterium HGW-Gammaproteobacteria-14]|nr:MAG: protein-export chaperone SecB [Gammaproteobacteria bacterium HGW-Gammaproteobacteria-14]